MVKTKGAAAAVKNWEGQIGVASTRYKEGVDRSSGWQQAAIAAADLYKQKVVEAANAGLREKGLQRVSDAEWKSKASGKGAARIGDGMRASIPKFQTGITEVIGVIESTTLPERSADVMSNVTNRCGGMANALHNHFKK